jgi:hypothetical protein
LSAKNLPTASVLLILRRRKQFERLRGSIMKHLAPQITFCGPTENFMNNPG